MLQALKRKKKKKEAKKCKISHYPVVKSEPLPVRLPCLLNFCSYVGYFQKDKKKKKRKLTSFPLVAYRQNMSEINCVRTIPSLKEHVNLII